MAQRRSQSTGLALAAGLAWIVFLSLIVLREVPQPSKDAQAYLEAGVRWPIGEQVFAASWLGSRHLTVAYYALFLWLFGPSADSLSVALATSFAVHGALILLMCYLVLRSWPKAVVIASAVTMISCCLRLWYAPLTEAPFTAANALVLLLWVCYAASVPPDPRRALGALALIGIVAGLTSAIRLGIAVFMGGMCLTVMLFRHLVAWTGGRWRTTGQRKAMACLTLAAAFALGSAASSASWRLWVGTPRPPQMYASLFFLRPIEHCGHARNGPVTRQLLVDMRAPSEYVPYWDLVAFVFRNYGPVEGDRLMKAVAFEALQHCIGPTTKRTLESFVEYLTLPLYRSRGFRRSTDEKFAELRRGLEKAVRERARRDAYYQAAGTRSMAEIADRRLSFVTAARRFFPDIRYVIDPPGAVFVAELVAVCALVLSRRRHLAAIWLPVCVYAFGTIAIASFSRGVERRFIEPFVPCALLVLLVTGLVLARLHAAGHMLESEAQPR